MQKLEDPSSSQQKEETSLNATNGNSHHLFDDEIILQSSSTSHPCDPSYLLPHSSSSEHDPSRSQSPLLDSMPSPKSFSADSYSLRSLPLDEFLSSQQLPLFPNSTAPQLAQARNIVPVVPHYVPPSLLPGASATPFYDPAMLTNTPQPLAQLLTSTSKLSPELSPSDISSPIPSFDALNFLSIIIPIFIQAPRPYNVVKVVLPVFVVNLLLHSPEPVPLIL